MCDVSLSNYGLVGGKITTRSLLAMMNPATGYMYGKMNEEWTKPQNGTDIPSSRRFSKCRILKNKIFYYVEGNSETVLN